jgi:hypothetical protein
MRPSRCTARLRRLDLDRSLAERRPQIPLGRVLQVQQHLRSRVDTMNRLADRLCFRTMFELTIPHDLDVPISLDFSVDRGAYRAQVYINGCVPGDASGCRRRPDARGLQSGGRLASSTRRPARSTASPSTRASSTRTAATSWPSPSGLWESSRRILGLRASSFGRALSSRVGSGASPGRPRGVKPAC